MNQPKALVINGDGINCDNEAAWALELAGFQARKLHTSELLESPQQILSAEMLAIPGGFSYGDEIASGKVLAIKLEGKLIDVLHKFVEKGHLLFGICNGFQVLVQMGLLPFSESGSTRVVSLTRNAQGRFLNRWVKLIVDKNAPCTFFEGLDEFELPVRHGEGRLALEPAFDQAQNEKIVKAHAALRYGEDVNGSFDSIAALTNSKGNVLGMMPHPEAFVRWTQHPHWTYIKAAGRKRDATALPSGLVMFTNARKYLG